ncbi:MAG: GlsB/YeaQ/YmgE family stress response membrane protein [Candidatus Dormibacteria bacterium]
MLHLVAFIVIGLVVGAFWVRKSRGLAALIRVVGGLVGSLLGGFISLAEIGSKTSGGKYGSIVIAIVVAILLGGLAVLATNMSQNRRSYHPSGH